MRIHFKKRNAGALLFHTRTHFISELMMKVNKRVNKSNVVDKMWLFGLAYKRLRLWCKWYEFVFVEGT